MFFSSSSRRVNLKLRASMTPARTTTFLLAYCLPSLLACWLACWMAPISMPIWWQQTFVSLENVPMALSNRAMLGNHQQTASVRWNVWWQSKLDCTQCLPFAKVASFPQLSSAHSSVLPSQLQFVSNVCISLPKWDPLKWFLVTMKSAFIFIPRLRSLASERGLIRYDRLAIPCHDTRNCARFITAELRMLQERLTVFWYALEWLSYFLKPFSNKFFQLIIHFVTHFITHTVLNFWEEMSLPISVDLWLIGLCFHSEILHLLASAEPNALVLSWNIFIYETNWAETCLLWQMSPSVNLLSVIRSILIFSQLK